MTKKTNEAWRYNLIFSEQPQDRTDADQKLSEIGIAVIRVLMQLSVDFSLKRTTRFALLNNTGLQQYIDDDDMRVILSVGESNNNYVKRFYVDLYKVNDHINTILAIEVIRQSGEEVLVRILGDVFQENVKDIEDLSIFIGNYLRQRSR